MIGGEALVNHPLSSPGRCFPNKHDYSSGDTKMKWHNERREPARFTVPALEEVIQLVSPPFWLSCSKENQPPTNTGCPSLEGILHCVTGKNNLKVSNLKTRQLIDLGWALHISLQMETC